MPVGTHSTVKTLTQNQLAQTQPQMILANAYHLYLRPGPALIQKAGGLHRWMNWRGPMLTDSGGFQVFSLSKHRKITEAGVTFRDPVSGAAHFIGPKESMAIQNALGPDVMMAFDECPPGQATFEQVRSATERTHRWLERCFEAHARPDDQALFPIVQGGTFESLREGSVQAVTQYPAHGYAIGGVSVGESQDKVAAITRFTAPLLPADKPRYLMGVGTPEDLLMGIHAGIDLFDCVMPTRVARHGAFFTPTGRQNIKNAQYTEDFAPLVEDCPCEACRNHSRAYIRHLLRLNESAGKTLLSIHNVSYLVRLTAQARQAVLNGQFDDFYNQQCQALKQRVTH